MVIKMFFSGISASKEVKKRQLRAQFLLDSYKIKYEMVDISDPMQELSREKMLREGKRRSESVPPMPPQFFNEEEYCGDFEDLESANDNDDLLKFLKLEEDISIENGNASAEGEYDLFVPPDQRQPAPAPEPEPEPEPIVEDEEDEEKNVEVVEQVTINGVVYTIPPNRKIEVGGRIIDVDELLATEGEEVELDEVAKDLKEQLESNARSREAEAAAAAEVDEEDGDENKENKEVEAETKMEEDKATED